MKQLLIIIAAILGIFIIGKLILGIVLSKLFWLIVLLTALYFAYKWIGKKLSLIIILLALPAAQSSAQEIWIPTPAISPHHLPTVWTYRRTIPIVQWTPAHSRHITKKDAWVYRITPYGGTNCRTDWTNYRPRDTSWGYRQGRPRAKDLGIKHQKLNHPNPRSLYRQPPR